MGSSQKTWEGTGSNAVRREDLGDKGHKCIESQASVNSPVHNKMMFYFLTTTFLLYNCNSEWFCMHVYIYYTHIWVVKIVMYRNRERCIFYPFFSFLDLHRAWPHPHTGICQWDVELVTCSVRDLSKKDCIRKNSRWTTCQGEHWAINIFQGTNDKPHGYFLFWGKTGRVEGNIRFFRLVTVMRKKGMDEFGYL